jgi:hypothetical protein
MRSMAAVKSAKVTASAPRRVASSAASLTRLARSAPVKPGVSEATCSRSSSPIELDLLHVHRQNLHPADLVRAVDQHLAVEAAGAQQRRIEDLGRLVAASRIMPERGRTRRAR